MLAVTDQCTAKHAMVAMQRKYSEFIKSWRSALRWPICCGLFTERRLATIKVRMNGNNRRNATLYQLLPLRGRVHSTSRATRGEAVDVRPRSSSHLPRLPHYPFRRHRYVLVTFTVLSQSLITTTLAPKTDVAHLLCTRHNAHLLISIHTLKTFALIFWLR